jgi:hypothetical protein
MSHSALLIAFGMRRGTPSHSLGLARCSSSLSRAMPGMTAVLEMLDKYTRQLTPDLINARRTAVAFRVGGSANATAGNDAVSVRLSACDREEIVDQELGKRVA